jgi:hypothetical protein
LKRALSAGVGTKKSVGVSRSGVGGKQTSVGGIHSQTPQQSCQCGVTCDFKIIQKIGCCWYHI